MFPPVNSLENSEEVMQATERTTNFRNSLLSNSNKETITNREQNEIRNNKKNLTLKRFANKDLLVEEICPKIPELSLKRTG